MNKGYYFIPIIIFILLTFFGLWHFVFAERLNERLKGRILLQVEDKGQAWYVDPASGYRIYLGRPTDAFNIMREFGLGVSESDFNSYAGIAPARLAGRILLRVESVGEAYYVNPPDLRLYYLGGPADAFRVMKKLSLGITNADLSALPVMANGVMGDIPETGAVAPTSENNKTLANVQATSAYPLHKDITATVFWVGEPVGNGSSEDNALSSWDDDWQTHFGGYDNPFCREGNYPCGFKPRENPFYVSEPFNDFDDNGDRKPIAHEVVPWAKEKNWGDKESMMKNRWVKIRHGDKTCYGQVEDTGPYEYNDYNYVFNNAKPINKLASSAGMDVSPALRDCLGFTGQNNDENKIDWQFVNFSDVPVGPWQETITTSQVNWH